MAGTTYQELLDGVANYYGSGSDQWAEIARYGVTEETLPIIQQVPGVTVTVSNSGKYLGYDYVKPFASTTNPASIIDSNVQTGAYGSGSFNAPLPASAVTDPSTGATTMQSGAKVASTGATLATIADRASLALVGVSLGTKLGKLIDSGIYAVNPEWWDEHYPTINPETWDDMATTQGGKNFIRSIFGLQNDDATMYLDERMLAYTYMTLLANGAYSSSGYDTDQSRVDNSYLAYPNTQYHIETNNYLDSMTISGSNRERRQFWGNGCLLIAWSGTNPNGAATIYGISGSPGATITYQENTGTVVTQNVDQTFVKNGQTFYYKGSSLSLRDASQSTLFTFQRSYAPSPFSISDAFLIALLGSIAVSGLDGVDDNPNASQYINPQTLINPTTGQPVTPNDSPDDVLKALRNQYPDLFKDSIYEDVPQPDGTTQRITYIPTPYPDTTNPAQPTTDTTTGIDPQASPQVNPNNRTKELIQHLTDTITQDPTPPDTGTGETPEPIVPVGEHASSLWAIYNPTLSQLNSFGAWLWDSNFVEQIKKMFNDPMQSIIGLHKVYATPSTGGSQNIKVGYLDSGVPSAVVTNQYTTVHCGSVRCPEYFGNVFDYAPYTEVQIFLPFIGIVPLNVSEVMRSTISVTYQVDVLTGACLAEVSVRRDGGGGILYTYAGNCAAQYPLSSGSYISVACAVGAVAAGAVGSFLTGNPAPLVSSLPALASSRTNVQHSGGYSGNAGAMGGKKPYLIITRPQVAMADNYSRFIGNPANHTTRLGSASGFVRVSSVHVEGMNATDNELNMIKEALEEGVIV